MRRGFAKKNVLIVLGVLMSLGLLIVGFLPTMLNLGLARGRIEGAIAQNLNGHVTIDELGLSWFGTQTISSLTILDEDANHVATLNLTLGESLVSLLRHGTRTLTLDLSGSMQMSVDEQGHLDVMSLLKPSAPDQPSALASMDSLSLKVQDFFVTLHDEKGKRDIEFSHLNGSTTYAPGQPLVATLQGDTTSGDLKGSVSLDLTMSDFLDHEGLVALQGASLNATLMANTVPMPLIETDGELRYLKVKLASPGLSDRLDVSIESEAVYEESQVSSLKGQFTLDHPYTEDGQLNIGLETLTGTLEGQRIPASLIQPLLANIHLVAERDFGSTLDLTAQFSTGQDKSVLVTVQASNFDFKVKGVIDASTRSMRGEFLSLSTTLAPELIATLANVKPDRAIPLSLELTRFTIPSLDKQGVFPLAELAATGSLQLDIDDSIMLAMLDSDAQDLSLSEFNVEFGTDRLADGVTLKGSSRGDFGHLILDEHITNLFDHEGSLQLANLLPEGTIRLVDLPGTRLARLIDDQSGVTKAMLSRPCTISLTSMASDEGLRFTFNFETHGVRAEVVAIRQPTKLVLETADVLVTLTPEVIELAQGELEQPIVLLEPVQATLALETQEFQGASWTDYDVMSAPLAFTLGLDALHLNQVPGLIEGVEVHAITSQLVTSLKPLTYKATGTFTLASSDASQKIAEVEFDVTSSSSRDNRPEGRIFFQKLKPVLIEQMLGRPKGNLSTWIGTWGKLTIDLSWSDESLHATLTPAFERLDGIFTATLDDQVINLSGQTSRFVIGAKAVNRLSRSIAAKSSASTTTSGQGRGNRRTRPSMRLV
ncbi:MAG: hypothetical protein O7G85_09450, partial [Planctomycetota bacterium]|nr:hypothetical protein [Planctomycetota bacterium]